MSEQHGAAGLVRSVEPCELDAGASTAPGTSISLAEHDVEDSYKLHRRFDRMGRLVGDAGMERLFRSRVMVIGLGGVGSFAAEALARSGVGHVQLVDFDLVCVTNSNRQLQALKGQIGKPKAEVLAERMRLINPQAKVEPIREFYSELTSERLLADPPDFVVDAIDNIKAKCHLLATCRERGIRVICSTGASGRMDPTAIKTADLAATKVDPLAVAVRELLRKRHGFPAKGDFGITAVYSDEPPAAPQELHYDEGKGFRCVCPNGDNNQHSCEKRSVIYGTAAFVTGTFGLVCGGLVVRALSASPT